MLSDKLGRGSPIWDALRTQTLSGPSPSSQASGPLTAASFLTLGLDAGLSAERVFTPGSGLAAVDGGANGNYALAVDATVARSTWAVNAGAGLTGGGNLAAGGITLDFAAGDGTLTVAANDVRVAQGFAFAWTGLQTWSQLVTFNAGATIAAGQNLNFGADVSLTRKNTNLLALAAGDSFQSTTYTSGLNGWNIGADGTAEFLNVRVRGEFSASVMVLGEITATAGTQGVFKSAAALAADYTAPGSVGASNTLIAKNSLAGASLLAATDILRIKSWNGVALRDLWFTVTAVGANSGPSTSYTVRLESGTVSTLFSAGTAIADYGPSGQGFVTLSADGTLGSSANMSVATHAGAPWTTQTLRVRLGNLNGSFGTSTDVYGIGMGDYSGGNYLLYNPTDNFVLKAGAGAVTIGAAGIAITAPTVQTGANSITWGTTASPQADVWAYADATASYLGIRSNPNLAKAVGHVFLDAFDSANNETALELIANNTTGKHYAYLTGSPSLTGFTIGNSGAPNAMLDVRGDAIVTSNATVQGGLAIGAATPSHAGSLWMVQGAIAGAAATPRGIFFSGGAHTALTLESLDVLFSLNRTVQYANASIPASSRAFTIQPPTYAAVSAGGVLADAATFVVTGAPIPGTNMTLTRTMALWVQAGWTRLVGGLNVGSSVTDPGAGNIQMTGTLSVGGNQVVTGRVTGYTNAWVTTAAEKAAARDAATITLVQLAQRVRALQESMTTHGLIGP